MTSVLVHGDQGLAVRRFRCAGAARAAQAPIESDGIGAGLMLRVCAWCKADLGVVVVRAEDGGKVTHGICPACERRLLAELPGVPGISAGGKPESALSVAVGQASVPLPAPSFRCVSGLDFGRAIRWARERWRNPLDALVRAKINEIKKEKAS